MIRFFIQIFLFFIISLVFNNTISAQKVKTESIPGIIQDFKSDPRGPYLDIKWFCDNGTIRDSKDPCPDEIGGNQHARYKDITTRLHKENNLYFGKILTGSDKEEFWNWKEDYDPIKQYILHKYLESVDDGWILKQAQFYRGAVQSEDEAEWAEDFFTWALASDIRLSDNYLLIRQAAKTITHREESKIGNSVRAISKQIADKYPAFMPIRTKLHSNPEVQDLKAVQNFTETRESKLSSDVKLDLQQLMEEMKVMFRPVETKDISPFVARLPKSDIKSRLEQFIVDFDQNDSPFLRCINACELLKDLRSSMRTFSGGKNRLNGLDVSIFLEEMIISDLRNIKLGSVYDHTTMLCFLNEALTGCGYIELREFEKAQYYSQEQSEKFTEKSISDLMSQYARITEWTSANFVSLYSDVVKKYGEFEPLSSGFIDDQIRSSVILPFGEVLENLSFIKTTLFEGGNEVFSIRNQEKIRGLNPGFAKGILRIIDQADEEIAINPEEIYIFKYPPSDLSPVKGIMTVNEGNMISHVQLLARNLGIPNAVLSEDNFSSLKKYEGEEIFYSVSLTGDVIMKKWKDINSAEKALFAENVRSNERITVDVSKIDLKRDSILNLRDLSGKDSGISCGPKAANLAQLKQIFPDNVVEGIVIPFGIYREHLDQDMETRSMTYWEFINQIFIDKQFMLDNGFDPEYVECVVLGELDVLRDNIKNIPLSEKLKSQLTTGFKEVLKKDIGDIPVFLRSDTNMEDLKDFTGAGLNLTKFNILKEDEIYQGIKDVWASPFTERSYKWRQSYLNNPENVYPSILVIPSVNVDYSGVIITKDIRNGNPHSMTLAFSRGVGGAVDGQKAETYLVHPGEYPLLLSPSRESKYRTIPSSGGTVVESTDFHEKILTDENIHDLYQLVKDVRQEMPRRTDMNGPYDIELGFLDGEIWLFQIRPFVENKNAISNEYLQSISKFPDSNESIDIYKNVNSK